MRPTIHRCINLHRNRWFWKPFFPLFFTKKNFLRVLNFGHSLFQRKFSTNFRTQIDFLHKSVKISTNKVDVLLQYFKILIKKMLFIPSTFPQKWLFKQILCFSCSVLYSRFHSSSGIIGGIWLRITWGLLFAPANVFIFTKILLISLMKFSNLFSAMFGSTITLLHCCQELTKIESKLVTVSLLSELPARQKKAQCRSYCELKLNNGKVATTSKIEQLSTN